MKAELGNPTFWSGSGAGRGCYNQKSRFDTLLHTDTGLAAAAAGSTYYYVLSAVDSSSDESVKSALAALTIAASGGGGGGVVVTGGGGGGGCFIAVAGLELSPDLLMPLAAMALLICLGWISRRRRG